MGELGSPDERVRALVIELADQLQDHYADPALARLWAARVAQQAIEKHLDDLLAEARSKQPGQRKRTWDEIGAALGMSAQGARQRFLRRGNVVTALPERLTS